MGSLPGSTLHPVKGWLPRLVVGQAVVVVSSLAACSPASAPCDQSGCDAVRTAVSDDGSSGIAGSVALQTDVIVNGCAACGFGATSFAIWKSDAPVVDAQVAKAMVNGSQPGLTVAVDGSYRQALSPGHYLVRTDSRAIAVDVVDGHLTTLHVVRGLVGPQFTLFDPQTKARQTPTSFDVGP